VNETPFSLQGRTKPFQDSLETSVDIEIDKLNIPRYMEYRRKRPSRSRCRCRR